MSFKKNNAKRIKSNFLVLNHPIVAMMGKNILIGGTGFVSKHLSKCLLDRGCQVTVLTRNKTLISRDSPTSTLSPKYMHWNDLTKENTSLKVDACINLAGENVLKSGDWTDDVKKKLTFSRVDSASKMLDFMKKNKSNSGIRPKFIMTSGVGYYPTGSDKVFDENDVITPSDPITSFCHDIETSLKIPSDFDHSIVRPGVVLGSGN